MKTFLISDVDGVLNCETYGSSSWLDEWDWGREHGKAECLITNEVDGVKTIPLRWSPLLIFRLNQLVRHHDVHPIWLTTWGELAQTRLPQITGLNCGDWPVLGEPEFNENRAELKGEGEWWKLTAIRNWYEQQTTQHELLGDEFRFVWIDDQLRKRGCLLWTASLPAWQVLTINPVSRYGISPDEMTLIERFAQ